MLTAKDMKDMIDMYSQFVEDKMILKVGSDWLKMLLD